jgi:hypothetical protein
MTEYRFGGKIIEFEPPRRVTWEWDWVPQYLERVEATV